MNDSPKPSPIIVGHGNTPQHHPIPPAQKNRRKKESWQSTLSTIAILLLAPLFALFLITFVFQSYLVDGPSMQSTLQDKDRLIVWKVPRTWARITGNPYIPARGDIIVFTEPNLSYSEQHTNKQLIKRIVGLPGERVVVRNGNLTIYNDANPEGFQPDTKLKDSANPGMTPGEVDVVVPEDHVFVAGDNRTNSLDSRAFGPIPAENIVGKLLFRFLPLDKAEHF